MKVGVDHYSFHRYFGEVYPEQRKPSKNMTLEGFIARMSELGAEGVTLESCFMPRFTRDYLEEVKGILDGHGMDRVYGWGHPDGLEGGKNEKAYDEMIQSLEHAKTVGAGVMKVVGSSLQFRHDPHEPQIEKLSRMFSDAVKIAEGCGVRMAVENHIDFTSEEMLALLKNVNSPYLGMNFDTGNFLRLLDDPVRGMQKLGTYVLATHVKDLKPQKGVPANEWYFFSCTPTGEGLVDIQGLAQILKDSGYTGFLAVEIDFLHPDYKDEDEAVAKSIKQLKRIAGKLR